MRHLLEVEQYERRVRRMDALISPRISLHCQVDFGGEGDWTARNQCCNGAMRFWMSFSDLDDQCKGGQKTKAKN